MKKALLILLLAGGCRQNVPLPASIPPPDLASPIYFCPPSEPASGTYACDPSAIPNCAFPSLEVTCTCDPLPGGGYALFCPVADLGYD